MTVRLLVISIMAFVLSTTSCLAEWRDPTAPQAMPNSAYNGYVLMAIMSSPDKHIAVINDKIVHEGDLVDNAKVLAIHDNTVELDSPNGRLTLTLVITPLLPVAKSQLRE